MIAIAAIGFFSIKSCFFSSSPEEERAAEINNLKVTALTYSHSCVEEKLKSPTSADFPIDLKHVTMINDSVFVVNSYVDAQNSFGAMIRTKFICKLTILKDDKYICNDVSLIE